MHNNDKDDPNLARPALPTTFSECRNLDLSRVLVLLLRDSRLLLQRCTIHQHHNARNCIWRPWSERISPNDKTTFLSLTLYVFCHADVSRTFYGTIADTEKNNNGSY